MPLTARTKSARLRSSAPAAISATTSALTAPCSAMVASRTPNSSCLAALL